MRDSELAVMALAKTSEIYSKLRSVTPSPLLNITWLFGRSLITARYSKRKEFLSIFFRKGGGVRHTTRLLANVSDQWCICPNFTKARSEDGPIQHLDLRKPEVRCDYFVREMSMVNV
jgi:hypothetical protein